MSKKVILTGLRANNDLTIGNYFGALLPIIDMAKNRAGEYQVNLFVPDLHSFTTPIDHAVLQDQIMHNQRVFAAAGLPLENPDVYIYRQSYIPAHSELTWILSCFTEIGQLSRMTQFKEKIGVAEVASSFVYGEQPSDAKMRMILGSQIGNINATAGLFSYPVLMAADILLYNATYVPVGEDQTQHLEFASDTAQRMNRKFGQELFTVPLEVKKQHELFGKDQGLRIMDLQDPAKKMSKSAESNKGVIFLSDTPDEAHKKIMGATTDSFGEIIYDPKERPGISNLIDILALLQHTDPNSVYERYKGQNVYGPLKTELADTLSNFLRDFQQSLSEVNDQKLMRKIENSEEAMRSVAGETLNRVQKAVGLR